MAGLYIHIPFCKRACTYCDFHFSTSGKGQEALLDAMEKELLFRSQELGDAPVGTIYFGGGTPSLLEPARIASFIQLAHDLVRVQRDAEVTLEANPDDITPERLEQWKSMGIRRLSLGTQSFREDRLRWMGRAHNAGQALKSIALIAKAGFASWTIDLIYGLPGMTLEEWDEQLTIALDHGMPHLSAYCLTVEAKTALAHQVKKAMVTMPGDADQSAQFDRLMERMEAAGLEHYEISNFGLPGHRSRHNSSYWEGVPYLGVGPSAHSFDGSKRRWNVANNARYQKAVQQGEPYWEEETLNPAQRTNERLLTGLRTSRGVELARLELDVLGHQRKAVERWMATGHLEHRDGRLVLTRAGRLFADRIASDLFFTSDDR
ncbi:MAG: radical SAM family heme chaperone HemW [Flavobacteriales bacterium]|jgi:oxygen-independent coproporphyrinogen-3 oxidase|nr:radical SAM family heme chaperone HemW [Flavobacteriales bacterium]